MAARKLTNNGPSHTDKVVTVGLDIGYGYTKALTETETVMFPSVYGVNRQIKFMTEEIAAKYPGDQITYDSGEWFIGELALSQLKAAQQHKQRKRLDNVARLRLAKVALGKLFMGMKNGDAVHVRIATGLPIDHMTDSAGLKTTLTGQHHIQTDATNFVAHITEVMVMPQPYGTIYREMLTSEGKVNPCHTAESTGVIDVGTYTVDLTLDNDGEYIQTYSASAESGVFVVHEAIAAAYENHFKEKLDQRRIHKILKSKCAVYQGQEYDYTAEVIAALTPLREATLGVLSDTWGAAGNIDIVYVSGGGAELVIDDIKDVYKQAHLVADPQLANARGYLNYALRKASAG